jgi:hypothetical protein
MKRAINPGNKQSGFIPMIIMIILTLAAVIYFAFKRVVQAQL